MKTGQGLAGMERLKSATQILEQARFPVHKWESNLRELESDGMTNPSKILGLNWDKDKDTLELTMRRRFTEEEPVTKKSILSHLGSIYDPLSMLSLTTVEGRRIYREACDEKKGWTTEISDPLRKEWTKWTKQLKNVTVPRTMRNMMMVDAVQLHVFGDASYLACCAAAIAVIEHSSAVVKGLLTSKSRISKQDTSIARLELTRRFTKRNWVAFMRVNISELEKGNGELYMAHGNLNITVVYLRYS